MAEDTLQDVFYENIESNSQVSQDLQDLAQILKEEKELKEQEQIEQQKEEKAAQQMLEEEKAVQKELNEFYVQTLTETSDTNEKILIAIQGLNENYLEQQEKQNQLHTEISFMLVFAVVISLAMQSFFNQITKW